MIEICSAVLDFMVAPILERLHGDFPALLAEEDLRFSSVHYLRHERAP